MISKHYFCNKSENAMLRLQTPVQTDASDVRITLRDKVVVLGSCFADNVGDKLRNAGFDVCVNPFGTLYNPFSIAQAVARLDSAEPFTEGECVPMGAGAGLICSFSHHTSFARPDTAAFLEAANTALASASAFWKNCNKVIITSGTIYAFHHGGRVVANCLKRPAAEFERIPMTLDEAEGSLRGIVEGHPDKEFIFTVSPVRHMADGAHGNQLSKSTLLLATEAVTASHPGCAYFPAYEIVMDELRDYRFYAEDMVHPSQQAVGYIWERFCESVVAPEDRNALLANEKAWRASQHRQLH